MRILVVDSNLENLERLKKIILKAFPNAVVDVEQDEEDACYLAERIEYSAVLTETNE